MTALLQVAGLAKYFGGLPVLEGFELRVHVGQLFALIGPNGSGKSTLLDVVTGAQAYDRGRILLDGRDLARLRAWERARLGIGRCWQESRLWAGLTGEEHLQTLGDSLPGRGDRPPIGHFAALTGLGTTTLRKDPSALPLLERRRLELTMAAYAGTKLLLLDELGAGLHVDEARALYRCVSAFVRAGHVAAAVMVEHRLELVAENATAAGLMRHGGLVSADREQRGAFDELLAGLFRLNDPLLEKHA